METRLTKMEIVLQNVLGKLEREEILTVQDVKDVQSVVG